MPEIGTCTNCRKRRICLRTLYRDGSDRWYLLCRPCFARPKIEAETLDQWLAQRGAERAQSSAQLLGTIGKFARKKRFVSCLASERQLRRIERSREGPRC